MELISNRVLSICALRSLSPPHCRRHCVTLPSPASLGVTLSFRFGHCVRPTPLKDRRLCLRVARTDLGVPLALGGAAICARASGRAPAPGGGSHGGGRGRGGRGRRARLLAERHGR